MAFSNRQYAKKEGQKLIRPILLFEKSNKDKITSSENTLEKQRRMLWGKLLHKENIPS